MPSNRANLHDSPPDGHTWYAIIHLPGGSSNNLASMSMHDIARFVNDHARTIAAGHSLTISCERLKVGG
jgi:hypothetical protein